MANGIDFSGAGEYFDTKQTNTGGGGCTGTSNRHRILIKMVLIYRGLR